MFSQYDQLTKTIADMKNKIQLQDTELVYLRRNDESMRSEVKLLKADYH